MEKIYFIINPHAKNGHCLKVWKQIEHELVREGIPFLAFLSEYSGHVKELATTLAKKAGEQRMIIVAVGGDGTLHEVVNGVVHYPNVSIGFIPAGSGNDFSRGFSIPKNPLQALKTLVNTRNAKHPIVDIGKVLFVNEQEHYFINNMGAGFDGTISKQANETSIKAFFNRFSLGRLAYVYLIIKNVFTYRRTTIELTIDGKNYSFDSTWFITVSNQPYYGGGMKISPSASPNDGLLNVTIVHKLSKLKFLFMFVSVFWGGHVRFKEVVTFEGRSISISSSEPILVHADGELIGETPLKIQVQHAVQSFNISEDHELPFKEVSEVNQ